MRIVKEHGQRRSEILDVAEMLFATKGYAHTTINDILEALQIAKGTLYHYFPSKEAVMEAAIARFINTEIVAAQAIADSPSLTAHEKMFRILTGAGRNRKHHDRLEEAAKTSNNAEMQQRTMASIVLGLSPILADIVTQGLHEGTFTTQYPRESVEILLAASEFLLHGSAFAWTGIELLQKAKALAWVAEQALGTEKGRLSYLYARYEAISQYDNPGDR